MATRIIGTLYIYHCAGQIPVDFVWRGHGRGGYIWSSHLQSRLASYRTLKALEAAYQASDNDRGAYGCAELALIAH